MPDIPRASRPRRQRKAAPAPAAAAAPQVLMCPPLAQFGAEPEAPDRPFYDVFISYRHHDGALVDELEERIRAEGFTPFRDLNFASLADTAEVDAAKIDLIRAQLQKATCLIFAFSRQSADVPGQGVGVWMPWELGFFDGALSARIGVYLLDGPRPEGVAPKDYFHGCEYLQLYPELDASNLQPFLRRFAVPERRIDNVAAAFVWMEHLGRECLANPVNVQLGVAEWWTDHWARLWKTQGLTALADACDKLKLQLDDLRVNQAAALRMPALAGLSAPADGLGLGQQAVTLAGPAPPCKTDAA